MLEVATLQSPNQGVFGLGDHHHHHHVDVGFPDGGDDDFLLDYIDFSTCDVPFFHVDDGDDILPDLEVDPTELLAEFADEPAATTTTTVLSPAAEPAADDCGAGHGVVDDAKTAVETQLPAETDMELPEGKGESESKTKGLELEEKDVKHTSTNSNAAADEVRSAVTTDDSSAAAGSDAKSCASAEGHSRRTSKPASASASASAKNPHGRRKVKVDWTPELHRRFVQAVEQLGLDKAVPSRILELMGNEYCLTRHNIASHLQKYRSHRKHLMAREAEAASWTQKRQMYAAAAGVPRKDAAAGGAPWVVPTIGFPPPGTIPHAHAAAAAMAHHHPGHPPPFCRPLHVWGHPTGVDAAAPPPPSMLPVWPRHLAPPPAWAHQPPVDPAYWHQQYNAARKWGPQAVTQGTPCAPPPMPPAAMLQRFAAPPMPGMMPHPMYRPILPPPPPAKVAGLQLQLDAHPSKESIDAAIGDVLVKPWLPLPLGLKPPSLDSVMSELHKQGIPKIPPAAAAKTSSAAAS